ncbi:D-glycero-beta-D-manno-heptose-7-phosphate kinase [Pedobacter petrophilus]|uniref:D-glycero-beta-D-manno-heptose-7-phosphate kinase n=2 Tax=Pedobacter petrophilus TaxID=1908241 RepID=A0A7K0G3J1_9SPHI|nr:D-glycero-beta-D-manno-heptose-7-phosphate kinase [Pedobacter petrophilus]
MNSLNKNMEINNKKVLVIGDLMIDHYIYGDCNRISPEAPVPVVEVQREEQTLGGAGNVLQNLQAMGCYADIVSIVGDDQEADFIQSELVNNGLLGNGLVRSKARCTTIKSRVLAAKHQLIRLDKENTELISSAEVEKFLPLFDSKIPLFDIVLISDYNKGLLTKDLLSQIFEKCKKHGKVTILDPKGLDFSKYRGVSIIKPNKKEAIMATGINIKDQESLKLACQKLQEITDCDHVIITLSEDGIAYFSHDVLNIIPTVAIDVVDVTGAGDTVLASLGIALANNNSLHDACVFANHAAAVVVNKVGSATATLEEIMNKETTLKS